MAYDRFRFSLKADDTTWYALINGLVTTSSTPHYVNAPKGWDNPDRNWKRSALYGALLSTIASPYIFIEESGTIIQYLYLNGSIETKVLILVERYDDDTLAYKNFLKGELDISAIDGGALFNNGIIGVSVPVIEGGIRAQLDAAENVPYEIQVGPASDTVAMDGLIVQTAYNYPLLSEVALHSSGQTGSNLTPSAYSFPHLFTPILEGDYNSGIGNAQFNLSGSTSTTSLIFAANHFYQASVNQTAKLHYLENIDVGKPFASFGTVVIVNVEVHLLVYANGAATPYQDLTMFSTPVTIPAGTTGVNLYVSMDYHGITLNTGDQCVLAYKLVTISGAPAFYNLTWNALGDFSFNPYFQLPATTTQSKRYVTVVSEMLELITGVTGVLQSSFLSDPNLSWKDCRPYHCRLTCGDALRNLTTDSNGKPTTPSIRITWRDLWTDMKNRFGLWMGIINGKIVIELPGYFLNNNTNLPSLGTVKTLSYGPAREMFANSAKWGYANQTYDKLNGRDEFNTTEYWKYPITRKTADFDNICPIRSDMYGIESIRINLQHKKTTDARTDNDTVLLETEDYMVSGAYPLYRPQNSYGQPADTGLIPETLPTAYNLTQRPVLNLLRNGAWLHSSFYGMDTSQITFQSSDKNASLSVDLGTGLITERDPIPVSSLDTILCKPVLFHIEAVVPTSMSDIMDAGALGAFPFEENGKTYRAFPMEVGIKSAEENSYQMTLLCTPDTDITQLLP